MTATAGASRTPVALYVHFPFCISVCPYCDFVVYGGRAARGPDARVAALVDALVTEIELRARHATLDSVYLGGGTPSLMSAGQVERLLAAAETAFGFSSDAEITIEINPGGGERGDLRGFRAAGANRLSIGAQSLSAAELRRLGRRHSPADVADTVGEARRAGFDDVSLDLLYDVPGQSVDGWRRTLAAALGLEPDHVSAYALTLDGGAGNGPPSATDDHLAHRAGALRWRARAAAEQDADRAADMYEVADEMLERAGLAWYELSNWARPGRASRHNLAYWRGAPWEAVGPGAHAFDGGRTRRWNAANLDRYLAALEAGRLPPGGRDVTDEAMAAAERAILQLRTSQGLSPEVLARAGTGAALAWAEAHGLAEPTAEGGRRLALRGRLLANEVFARILPPSASVGDADRRDHGSSGLDGRAPFGYRATDQDRQDAALDVD